MISEILELLDSSIPRDRARGWRLAWENRAELRSVAPKHKEKLLRHFLDIEDPQTRHLATAVIVTVIPEKPGVSEVAVVPDAISVPPTNGRAELLGDWLWAPFRTPSTVFSTTEPNPFRRDELAEICVARRLGYQYDQTEFERVLLRGSEWQELLSRSSYQAACFIGRFGLYGDDAPDRLVYRQARLEFPEQFRPRDLKPNEIDDGLYHCIYERRGSNSVQRYTTTARDGKRTDYALIQRYPRRLNVSSMVVVNLAGCTSLGTFAAAHWAALKLFQPIDSTGKLLAVPPEIREDSVLEALVKVTAADTGRAWRVLDIQLARLFVDDQRWSPENVTWEEVPISEICLQTQRDGAPVFMFDGRPSPMKSDRQYGRLLAAMMRQKERRGTDEIDLDELADDTAIWKTKKGGMQTVSIKKVGDVLRSLRSLHLHSALTVRKEGVWLHSEVRFEGPDPPKHRTIK